MKCTNCNNVTFYPPVEHDTFIEGYRIVEVTCRKCKASFDLLCSDHDYEVCPDHDIELRRDGKCPQCENEGR